MWFIDWYNYIVQHNPTPQGFRTGKGAAYETELRDKKHGRIYRLAYVATREGEAPAEPKSSTAAQKELACQASVASTRSDQLVAALKSDNMFWRSHAQRLLVERGDKYVAPALIALVKDQSVDAIGLNTAANHALWTLHGLGAMNGEHADATAAAIAALKHPSAGVRRNAIQVVAQRREDCGGDSRKRRSGRSRSAGPTGRSAGTGRPAGR